MDPKGLLGLLFLVVALAGCLGGGSTVDADSDDDVTDEVDCEALLAEHEGETQEEHDAHPAEERLPEECEDLWVPAEPQPGPPTWFNLRDCVAIVGVFPVPEEMFGSPPDGFSYNNYLGTAVPAVEVDVVSYTCQELETPNGTIGPVTEIQGFVWVTPPADMVRSDAMAHYVAFDFVSGDDDAVAFYNELGILAVREADVSLTMRLQGDQGRQGSAGYRDDGFQVELDVAAAGPSSAIDALYLRVFYDAFGDEPIVVDYDTNALTRMLGGADVRVVGSVPPFAMGGVGAIDAPGSDPYDIKATLVDPSA